MVLSTFFPRKPQNTAGSSGGMLGLMVRLLPVVVLGTVLCSVANMILTRTMNASEYGAFSFFLSTINLMSLIGLLGFQQTLPRFLSLYERERKPELAFGFIIAMIVLVILATAAATVIGIYAVVPFIRNTTSHRCLNEGYYLATMMALVTLFSAYLNYHRHAMVSSGAGPDGAIYQFVLIGTVLVAQLLPHTHSGLLAVEVVGSMGIAVAVCLVFELVWCALKVKNRVRGTRPAFRLREWLSESFPVGGSALLGTLIYSADIIAVRLIAGSASAAEYAVASSLATFVIIPRSAASKYFSQEAPHVPEPERSAALQRLIRRVLNFNLLSAASVGLVIALLNQQLLGLYGQTYLVAWPALLLLIVARALEGPASVGVKLLNLEGYGKNLAGINLLTGAVLIGLLAGLVGWLGHNGAALAVIVFVLLSNALFYRGARNYLGLHLLPSLRAPALRTAAES